MADSSLSGDIATATQEISNDQKRPKRRNLGRQARKRRKKMLEIEAAASALTNPVQEVRTVLPKDRGYVWPAVKDLCTLSKTDEQDLIGQLGYLPGNAISVGARACEALKCISNDSAPLVLKLYPLVLRDEADSTKSRRKRKRHTSQSKEKCDTDSNSSIPLMEPFPTLYWVTHPQTRALISKLELDGWGLKFEKRLEEDDAALTSMKLAHKQYGEERQKIITTNDWKWIKERKWDKAFDISRGVAGIRNPNGIKCLHAHAAHYWSGCSDNVVGRWVSEQVLDLLTKSKV